MTSVDWNSSVITGSTAHDSASLRQVFSFEDAVSATIGFGARKRETNLAVAPDCVHTTISFASRSIESAHAECEIASSSFLILNFDTRKRSA